MTKTGEILCMFMMFWLKGSDSAISSCPMSCECWKNVVECTTRGLARLPPSLPNGTLELLLANNSITTV